MYSSPSQNYYPVEKDKPGMWYWGFKYNSGVFEFFYHSEKQKAEKERQAFKLISADFPRIRRSP